MQAVCKYAEEQREDRGCAYCYFNKAWYGLWYLICKCTRCWRTNIYKKTAFWEMSLTHDDLSNLCILISLLFLDYILINVKTFRQMTRFANFYGVIMVLSFIVSWQIFNVYFNFLVFLILFFVSYKIWQFKKK